jgi:hypothetical protein
MNPMAERKCTIDDNVASAALLHGATKLYGPAFVEVEDVDAAANVVTFKTTGVNGSSVSVTCKWARENVWARCPTTLNCDEQTLPAKKSSGTLYVSQQLVTDHHLNVNVKWPVALPGNGEYRQLRIWPTSIKLCGVELATGDMQSGTLELLDPNQSAPGQTLTLRDGILTIGVSQVGAAQFVVPWDVLGDLDAARAVLAQPHASARERARAWAQIANWEELLAETEARTEELDRARSLLNMIREMAR